MQHEATNHWIQSLDGRKIDLHNPSADCIDPTTLATVLARMPRFGGHTRVFYSVAQHSVLVANLVQEPELKLPALLHDAHEAYWGFGDITRPAKLISRRLSHVLQQQQRLFDWAIADRFGFDPKLFEAEQIHRADALALATEARDLMAPPPEPWDIPAPLDGITVTPLVTYEAFELFSAKLRELWPSQES